MNETKKGPNLRLDRWNYHTESFLSSYVVDRNPFLKLLYFRFILKT